MLDEGSNKDSQQKIQWVKLLFVLCIRNLQRVTSGHETFRIIPADFCQGLSGLVQAIQLWDDRRIVPLWFPKIRQTS